MKATEAVRAIMEKQGIRFSVLCDKLGVKSNVLAGRMKMDNISIDKLNEMLRVMDYKILIVPRDTRVGEDSFKID